MNEITILDTVFRDYGALGVGAVAHPEDVLGTHVIFGHPPLDFLRLVNRVFVVAADDDDFVAGLFCDNIQDDELFAVHIIIRRERAHFNVDEVAHVETGEILTVEFGDGAIFGMLGICDLLNGVADVLRGDVVQFIRGQVEVAAEIRVHINLESATHQDIAQVVFATSNGDFRVFNIHEGGVIAVPGPAKLFASPREL